MASGNLSWMYEDSNGYTIYGIFLDWSSTTNVTNNTSTITGKYYLFPYRSGMSFTPTSSSAANKFIYNFNGTSYSVACSYAASGTTYTQYQDHLLYTFTHTVTHNSNGSKTVSLGSCGFLGNFKVGSNSYSATVTDTQTMTLDTIPRGATLLTAAAFNDEENPAITYSNPAGSGVTALEACISLDGSTANIPYRSVSKTGTSYTFALTDDERNTLRAAIPNAQSTQVTFILRTTIGTTKYTSTLKRDFTIVNCAPELTNPVVKNVDDGISELTGDENKLIRYVSMVEYGVTVTPKKYATIVNQSVTNGTKTIEGLAQGVIDDIESGLFVFSATDSRGLTSQLTVERDIIDYVKPTCYQTLETEMAGETGAAIHLKIHGNYFNDTFGAVRNTLKLEVRFTNDDGVMGDWIELIVSPTFEGNTYVAELTFNGFRYDRAYTFQCRATDKLNVVQSAQYTVKVLPIFDWSEEDFNFNVPVKLNGQTVLRHNKEANNTVISASGGHIYLRPNGTDDTTGEVIINPDGTIVSGGSSGDSVVETGTEAMGSNGTWYWQKWASGKAECWGRRNYGSMAVTTSWGNLYRSAYFNQDLPSGLFITTPEAIMINMVDSDKGGFICKHENAAPTASTTGAFIYARPASATASRTHIGFHVIGRWKADENAPIEVTGTLTAINRDSSDNITSLAVDGTTYQCVSGVTHTNQSGQGFATGITVTLTIENGLVTHFVF